jgi:hypothetical protein
MSVFDWMRKRKDEQAELQQQHEAAMREKFGFGRDLHSEAQKTRDNSTVNEDSLKNYLWSVARGTEDKLLRPDAAVIVKRNKLSALEINQALSDARRYLWLEQYLASNERAPLTAARAAALRTLNEVEASRKRAIEDFNTAVMAEEAYVANLLGFKRINNPLLFDNAA